MTLDEAPRRPFDGLGSGVFASLGEAHGRGPPFASVLRNRSIVMGLGRDRRRGAAVSASSTTVIQAPEPISAGDIYANLTVGDVSGQFAVGNNIFQLHVDHVHGDLVTVAPPDARPRIERRQQSPATSPRRPATFFDRRSELATASRTATNAAVLEFAAHEGMGKSTLLRYLAHELDAATDGAGATYISARRESAADLQQRLFDAYFETDRPYKPGVADLGKYLGQITGPVLIDDVSLDRDDVGIVCDLLHSAGVIVASSERHFEDRDLSVVLSGLPPEDAIALFVHQFGAALDPDEERAARSLVDAVHGSPLLLIRAAAIAREDGTLRRFLADPVRAASETTTDEHDRRLLAFLAAVPGATVTAEQANVVTGIADTQSRLERLANRGVAHAEEQATGAPVRYGVRTDIVGTVDPSDVAMARVALVGHMVGWARTHAHDLDLAAHDVDVAREAMRVAEASTTAEDVVTLGIAIEPALAYSGRWDAWKDVLQQLLDAARTVGDQRVMAFAMHQLGTRALCLGELGAATAFLTDALRLRRALPDVRATAATQHNLNVLQSFTGAIDEDGRGDHRFARARAAVRGLPLIVKIVVPLVIIGGVLAVAAALTNSRRASPSALGVTPVALPFDNQIVETSSATRPVTLSNTGEETLRIEDIAVADGDIADFVVMQAPCRDHEIRAQDHCTVQLAFRPTQPGSRDAILRVTVADHDPVDARVSGTGVVGERTAVADPPTVQFGDQPVSTASDPKVLTLVNRDTRELTIGTVDVLGADRFDFDVVSTTCSGQLVPPEGRCPSGVVFHPTREGPRNALLVFSTADGDQVSASLVGAGVEAPSGVPTVEPKFLAFGDQQVATASKPRRVTVTNTDDRSMRVDDLRIDGVDSAEFGVSTTSCRQTVVPGRSCVVDLVFHPTGIGSRQAALTLTRRRADPTTVTLTGTGTPLAPEAPTPSPTSLDFGTRKLSTLSESKSVTLVNNASTPLHVENVTVTGDARGDFNRESVGCTGSDIGARSSCVVTVQFVPTDTGTRSGLLVFAAGDHEITVPLSARGEVSTGPTVEPTAVSFDDVEVGEPSGPQLVTFRADDAIQVTRVELSDTGSFRLAVDECSNERVESRGTCRVTVTFAPSRTGPSTATLTFGLEGEQARAVTLTGRGVDTHQPEFPLLADSTYEATGPDGATVEYPPVVARDAVDNELRAACTPASGVFPLGTTRVTCSVTDRSANSAQATFNVIVQDTTPPVLQMPDNITVPAENATGATVPFSVTATDEVDASVVPRCNYDSGTRFPLGDTAVACSATDGSGNASREMSFVVTVKDQTAPVFRAFQDTTYTLTVVEQSNGSFAFALDPIPIADDNVDGPINGSCNPTPGFEPGPQEWNVDCSATDAARNSTSGTLTAAVVFVPFIPQLS